MDFFCEQNLKVRLTHPLKQKFSKQPKLIPTLTRLNTMPMMLRSGRLTGSRGIFQNGRWDLYIKPSEEKEAQDMLRGKIPILYDQREMIEWSKDPNRDDRPSPQDVALARTMCIAGIFGKGPSRWIYSTEHKDVTLPEVREQILQLEHRLL